MAENWWESDPEDNWWEGSPEVQFPGMPQSLQPDAPQDFSKPPAVGGTLQQLAEFQKNYKGGPPEPPPMLARAPGQRDPVNMESVLRRNLSQAGSFGATPQPEDMPEGADAKLGMAATIATLPFLAGAPPAVAGGIAGLRGLSAANKAKQIVGAGATVAKTGAVFYAADKALEAAGIPPGARAAVLAAAGVTRPGESAREAVKGLFKKGAATAETLPARVAAAREAASVASAVPAEKKAASEAAKAFSSAKVAEPVPSKPDFSRMGQDAAEEAAAIGPIQAPPKPYPTGPTPEYKEMLRKDLAERAERFAQLDRVRAAEREALSPQFIPDDAVSIAPEPQFISDDALALVADPIPPRIRRQPVPGIVTVPYGGGTAPLPAGQRAPATNLGGKAKAGPPPTKPEDLEATLKASIEKEQIKQALKGAETPIDPASLAELEATAGQTEKVADLRKTLGSEKVARQMGMDRGQVQRDAGVITDEALGEVSKLIPTKAWEKIVKKAMSLPPEARPAYIAKMHGGKNLAQGEALLRTLKAAGLMIPIGVAGAAMGNER